MIERTLRNTVLTTAMLAAFSLSEVLGPAVAEARDLGVGDYIYSDVLKPHGRARSNDQEHANANVCDGGDNDKIGTAPFDACMRSHGWRFARFNAVPPNDGGVPDWAWTCPFSGSNC